MSDDELPLTVVVHTLEGWPEIRFGLERILDQARSVGGEVIVVDGSDRPAPPEDLRSGSLRWLRYPGESVVRLRHRGYAAARGNIVAVTEDHCEPVGEWARRIVQAHAEHPEVAAIGGTVENAAPDHLMDWAYYFVTQMPWIPPPDPTFLVGHTNLSYKRWAAQAMPWDGPLSIEILYNRELRRQGHAVSADDRIRVRHDLCLGVAATHVLEFHNARTVAGICRDRLGPRDWMRIAAPLPLAVYRAARDVKKGLRKRVPRGTLLRAVPLIASLHLVHVAGEMVGYATGQGDSGTRLR